MNDPYSGLVSTSAAVVSAKEDISVVIPVRDSSGSIEKCLKSLEAQSLPRERFEVIVVDNGSIDDTVSKALRAGARCVSASGVSVYAARNRGAGVAVGRLVAFTDSDCEVDSRWLETVGLFNPLFQHYGEDMEYASCARHLGLRTGVVPSTRAFHDRANRDKAPPNAMRSLALDRALIRYRLARFEQSTPVNMLSVLSYLLFAGIQTAPWHRRWSHKVTLLWTAMTELPSILRQRRFTALPGKSFFSEAAFDSRKYGIDYEGQKTHAER